MEPTLPTPSTVEGSAMSPNVQSLPSAQEAPEAVTAPVEKAGEHLSSSGVSAIQPLTQTVQDNATINPVVATPTTPINDDNPQIAEVKLTDQEHKSSEDAKIAGNGDDKVWFAFVKTSAGPVFKIDELSASGEVLNSKSIDVRTSTNF